MLELANGPVLKMLKCQFHLIREAWGIRVHSSPFHHSHLRKPKESRTRCSPTVARSPRERSPDGVSFIAVRLQTLGDDLPTHRANPERIRDSVNLIDLVNLIMNGL